MVVCMCNWMCNWWPKIFEFAIFFALDGLRAVLRCRRYLSDVRGAFVRGLDPGKANIAVEMGRAGRRAGNGIAGLLCGAGGLGFAQNGAHGLQRC